MIDTLTATKPRLGFAGIGWIGRNRLQAVRENSRAIVGGITDPNRQVTDRLNHEIPEVETFPSFEEMVESDLDGIVIATPSALHASQALSALQHGKAVFCQKPLGRNEQETQAVVKAAREADLLLGVDFSYRHTEALQRVREVVASGELGRIYGVNLTFHNAYGPDKSWYFDPDLSGGGCLIDLGVHLVDMLYWIMDSPEITDRHCRLFHDGSRLQPGQVEDFVHAQMTLNGETSVQLSCSWNLPAGREAMIEAAFYGEQGGVAFRNIDGSFYNFTAEKFIGTRSETLAQPPDRWSGRAAVEWAEQLTRDTSFDPGVETTVQVSRTLDHLYREDR